MSLHKLTAGDGYTYLTRQVAVGDSTERGYTCLADYYSAKGEAPGRWAGRGLASLGVSGIVTERQMRNLFGEGLHPDADRIQKDLLATRANPEDRAKVSRAALHRRIRLGRQFPVFAADNEWRERLSAAYAAWNTARNSPVNHPIDAKLREDIRTGLARSMFGERHGRPPGSAQELSGFLAQVSRPQSSAVAGFDLTFSPVKSVSTLWAVASPELSEAIEASHHAAVTRTMNWLETEAGYTRSGTRGPAQLETRGLVTARFTHRDSRAGDPDLHTHVAVSSKVQTADGRWLALDARMLYRLNVAGSEHYNTCLEEEISTRLGATFAPQSTEPGKRPVREIVGVDDRLNQRWSTRRRHITTTRQELTAQFLAAHGRVPTTVEMIGLSQQANLATREAKHKPRSLAEQRAAWHDQARDVLGDHGVQEMLTAVTKPRAGSNAATELLGGDGTKPTPGPVPVTPHLIGDLAAATLRALTQTRAMWRESNVVAEALRQVRGAGIDPALMTEVAHRVTTAAIAGRNCMPVGTDTEPTVPPPIELTRSDGNSVYRLHKGQLYTATSILDAETRIVAAAGIDDGRRITAGDVEIAALEWSANNQGRVLNHGQHSMVSQVATSGARVQLALAPAGSGKTTVMGVLAAAWRSTGGTVVGLAPQASAAQELGDAAPGVQSDTLDKLVHQIDQVPAAERLEWVTGIGRASLVIIDEVGLASTPKLDTAIRYVTGRGGRILLVGDDQQRAAPGAGGVLRDVEAAHGAITLDEVLRFTDPVAGQASLALRDGDPSIVGYLADRGQVHAATPDTVAADVYAAWAADVSAGADSIMIAPTLDMVVQLNSRARTDRIARDGTPETELTMPNGEIISAGDVIISKRNNRRLALGGTDFVKNNYRWIVTEVNQDGSITATEMRRRITRTLPAWYIKAGHVRLGYAHTHASVQGMTIGAANRRQGTAHAVVTSDMTRNDLYPVLTRAADATHAYVVLGGDGDPHEVIKPDAIEPPTAVEILTAIVGRDGAARSVTTELRDHTLPAVRLGPAADAYVHAITTGAEAIVGPEQMAALVDAAETAVPGITGAAAWETLRGHLAVLAAEGKDPIAELTKAVAARELDTAKDIAAVLDWRLDPSGNHSQQPGPLPWLPAIPAALRDNRAWGAYLDARARQVTDYAQRLREEIAGWSLDCAPGWAVPYLTNHGLVADLGLWRAAESVPVSDLRPAGPAPLRIAMRQRHHDLTDRAIEVAGNPADGSDRWEALLGHHAAALTADDYWPVLAGRLTLAETAGLQVPALLTAAVAAGPLPSEAAAGALWWRLAPHLGAVTPGAGHPGHHLRPTWTPLLHRVLGDSTAQRIVDDRLWPVIVSRLDTAARNGLDPESVVAAAAQMVAAIRDTIRDHELAVILLCNISLLTDPDPMHADHPDVDADPGYPDPEDSHRSDLVAEFESRVDDQGAGYADALPHRDDDYYRSLAATEQPDDVPVDPHKVSADEATEDTGDDRRALQRIYDVLAAAEAFYSANRANSWVPRYLQSRCLPTGLAGYAPAGWTTTLDHLRAMGFTNQEIQAAGLARTSSRGNLIDLFRDRVTLPIHTVDGRVAGFIGRKPGDANDSPETDPRIPKYLNSPTTAVFDKSALLYGLGPEAADKLRRGADLAIVEGPLDAAALTTALADPPSGNDVVVVSPLGTALSAQQLSALSEIAPLPNRQVMVLLDSDDAGRNAAVRAHKLLAEFGVSNATTVTFTGKDPAEMLQTLGASALVDAVTNQKRPLVDLVVDATVARWPLDAGTIEARIGALRETAPLIAALSVPDRHRQADRVAQILALDAFTVLDAVDRHRPKDPHPADNELAQRWRDHHRLERDTAAYAALFHDRWVNNPAKATELTTSTHFAALAHQLRAAGRQGIDIPTLLDELETAATAEGVDDLAAYVASAVQDRTTSTRFITDQQRRNMAQTMSAAWTDQPGFVERITTDPHFDQLVNALTAAQHHDLDLTDLLSQIRPGKVAAATDPVSYLTYQVRTVDSAAAASVPADLSRAEVYEGAEHVIRQAWADHPGTADKVVNGPAFTVLADQMAAAEQDGLDATQVLAGLKAEILTAPDVPSPSGTTSFAFEQAVRATKIPGWQHRTYGDLTDIELSEQLAVARKDLQQLIDAGPRLEEQARLQAEGLAADQGAATCQVLAELDDARRITARLGSYLEIEEQWHDAVHAAGKAAAAKTVAQHELLNLRGRATKRRAELDATMARLIGAEQIAKDMASDFALRGREFFDVPALAIDRERLADRLTIVITDHPARLDAARHQDQATVDRTQADLNAIRERVAPQRQVVNDLDAEARIRRQLPPDRLHTETIQRAAPQPSSTNLPARSPADVQVQQPRSLTHRSIQPWG